MSFPLTRAERRFAIAHLERENSRAPERMAVVPPETWPETMRAPGRTPPARVWRSKRFLAQLFEDRSLYLRLSVNRTMLDHRGDWLADLTWDDLMLVKNECGFGDWWAVEVFPAEREVVNVANMRHLWLLDEAPPYGWRKS